MLYRCGSAANSFALMLECTATLTSPAICLICVHCLHNKWSGIGIHQLHLLSCVFHYFMHIYTSAMYICYVVMMHHTKLHTICSLAGVRNFTLNCGCLRWYTKHSKSWSFGSHISRMACIAKLVCTLQVRQLLLDPAVNREFLRIQKALEEKTDEAKRLNEELQVIHFSQESKAGRMLMAKCRTLSVSCSAYDS